MVSCNDQPEIKPFQKSTFQAVSITSLANEPQLERVLDIAGFRSGGLNNSRSNNGGDELDIEEIMKVVQEDSLHHTFTFKIENNVVGSFSNLVIEEMPGGDYLAFILLYEFEGYFNFYNYSGKITRFDLAGTLLSELSFLNGEILPQESNEGAKGMQGSTCLMIGNDKSMMQI